MNKDKLDFCISNKLSNVPEVLIHWPQYIGETQSAFEEECCQIIERC